MALYISFNDSVIDPTYASADEAVLVYSKDNSEDNPCISEDAVSVPVLPNTYNEILTFANLIGWDVGYDNDGQVILYTGKNRT